LNGAHSEGVLMAWKASSSSGHSNTSKLAKQIWTKFAISGAKNMQFIFCGREVQKKALDTKE
jgi:hypothetical protein